MLVAGWTREGPVDLVAELDPAAPAASGIALRWARSRVVELLDGVHFGADPENVRQRVVDLGLEFGLVTPYTSLVAVEEQPSALGPVAASRLVTPLPSGGSGRPLRRWIGLLLAAGGALLYGLCSWTRP